MYLYSFICSIVQYRSSSEVDSFHLPSRLMTFRRSGVNTVGEAYQHLHKYFSPALCIWMPKKVRVWTSHLHPLLSLRLQYAQQCGRPPSTPCVHESSVGYSFTISGFPQASIPVGKIWARASANITIRQRAYILRRSTDNSSIHADCCYCKTYYLAI